MLKSSKKKNGVGLTMKIMAFFLALLLAGTLTGCKEAESVSAEPGASDGPGSPIVASSEPSPSWSASPSPAVEPSLAPEASPFEETEPEFVNPLTGLEIDPAYLNRRPVAVMINNLKQALPQFGIQKADILYEVVAEGGITRLVSVFQNPSTVGILGSVRSTRSYYLDLAQGHDALLLHAGASPQAYSDIQKRGVTALDAIRGGYEGSLYYRDAGRKVSNGFEHSLMTSGERIEKTIQKAKFRTEHSEGYTYPMLFDRDLQLTGDAAGKVTVRFSPYKTGVFEYSEESGNYLVSQYGKAHRDAGEDCQLAFKNLLVLYTDISMIPGDTAGRMKVDLIGEGQGIFFCGGQAVEIRWAKDAYTAPFVYTNLDGTNRSFHPGNTYICIVSTGATVTFE